MILERELNCAFDPPSSLVLPLNCKGWRQSLNTRDGWDQNNAWLRNAYTMADTTYS